MPAEHETSKMTPKLSNLKIVLGYWNENSDSCFRFNDPKQCSNWIIFVSFCSSHLAIKNWYNVHFMKTEEIDLKIQKSLCITTKTCNFKRNSLENYNDSEDTVKTKNAPLFRNFSNINKNWQLFFTGLWSFKLVGMDFRKIHSNWLYFCKNFQ